MFSHPPCALHSFIACGWSGLRRRFAGLDLDFRRLLKRAWKNALNSESAISDNCINLSMCYGVAKNKSFP
jgi:hypothetical protein